MPFLFIPYIVQLFCVIHVIKTRRNANWIWVIVMLPYVGGLAYLFIEMLPSVLSGRNIDSVKASVIDFINPNQKLETLRQRAKYSPTYRNNVEYADALMDRGEYRKALELYVEQNAGAFLDDPELLYRIATAQYYCGSYNETLRILSVIEEKSTNYRKSGRENLLYLLAIEKTRDANFVKSEYRRVMNTIRNNSVELPYLDFLLRINDVAEITAVIERIREDERAMIANNSRYDRRFYKQVYSYRNKIGKAAIP